MGKFFNKDVRKSCSVCAFGVKSEFSNEIFCKKRGVVQLDGVCRKYKYDVLKRSPQNSSVSKNYSAEDFIISN